MKKHEQRFRMSSTALEKSQLLVLSERMLFSVSAYATRDLAPVRPL